MRQAHNSRSSHHVCESNIGITEGGGSLLQNPYTHTVEPRPSLIIANNVTASRKKWISTIYVFQSENPSCFCLKHRYVFARLFLHFLFAFYIWEYCFNYAFFSGIFVCKKISKAQWGGCYCCSVFAAFILLDEVFASLVARLNNRLVMQRKSYVIADIPF